MYIPSAKKRALLKTSKRSTQKKKKRNSLFVLHNLTQIHFEMSKIPSSLTKSQNPLEQREKQI